MGGKCSQTLGRAVSLRVTVLVQIHDPAWSPQQWAATGAKVSGPASPMEGSRKREAAPALCDGDKSTHPSSGEDTGHDATAPQPGCPSRAPFPHAASSSPSPAPGPCAPQPALVPSCHPKAWGWVGTRWPGGVALRGRWLHRAVDRVRSQYVPQEPVIVPGGRTMPGELPGHHGLLHSTRLGSHLHCLGRASLTLGSPVPSLPPVLYLSPVAGSALAALGLWRGMARHDTAWHSTAQLSQGFTEPNAKQQHLCASLCSSSSSSSPQEGGDRGVHA